MREIFVTRLIPERGLGILRERGYRLAVSKEDRALTKEELIAALKERPYDAVLCLLTDGIDAEVFDAAPNAKIFANYAVGFNNIDVEEAKKRGVVVTNTPGVLTDTVAEHTFALLLALTLRVVEGDRLLRAGKFSGWAPLMLLGSDLKGKTLGILGAGRIGERVLHHGVRGFDMRAIYYDVKRNRGVENEYGARFRETPEDVLKEADVVSIHVPLLSSTRHLINAERLSMMKKTSYLVNTSRGEVVDEAALVKALRGGVIRGAALDVFENEPDLTPGLADLPNVVITPHIASATEETRAEMSRLAAENIVDFFEGRVPRNKVN